MSIGASINIIIFTFMTIIIIVVMKDSVVVIIITCLKADLPSSPPDDNVSIWQLNMVMRMIVDW